MPYKDIEKRREYYRRYRKEHKEQTYASRKKYIESHPDYYKKMYERRKANGTACRKITSSEINNRSLRAIERYIRILEKQKSLYVTKIERAQQKVVEIDNLIMEQKAKLNICKEK